MIVGVVAMIFCIANAPEVGGFVEGFAKMGDIMSQNGLYPPTMKTIVGVGSLIILTSFGTWGMPQMVQKFYAIRSEKAIDKGMIISTLFAFVVAGGCYFLGGCGRKFSTPELVAANGYDSIIPSMRCV